MANHTDLTFITNDTEKNLLERFKVLIKDTQFFDVLVGYFYTSGFHALYKSLEQTQKIRILIGISTNHGTKALIRQASQAELQFSHAETKTQFSELLVREMDEAEDSKELEAGVEKFLTWLKDGKLEIKAYPTANLHAKLYIMTFVQDDRDIGRVITGSSNFTQAGLVDNLEFNTELKARADYEFAKSKFEELWQDAADIGDIYIQTIQEKTWLNNTITPYELYLKFLYEYFKEELQQTGESVPEYAPTEFKQLEYQQQAVLNAKKILEEYGGVFLSDVVGLGKTYMSAMLASQLDGRTLVLAPPVLLEKANPGSWPNVFSDFRVAADCESIGKLDHIISSGDIRKYKNVFIDEAHRFRTESTITYEKLAKICRGKRVVLVTATPLNNAPKDILSQIKLFQNVHNSTIPNVPNLESFFGSLANKTKNLDRQKERNKYMQVTKENAQQIRKSVLKYLMVRRTRKEIQNYFADDLAKQGLKFPEVEAPKPAFYQLNKEESAIFDQTVKLIAEEIKYARYTPLLYYRGQDASGNAEKQSQKNMRLFMKILLIKRLESSFYAFRNTVKRFIEYHNLFLRELNKGNVYISRENANKLFALLSNEDDAALQKMLDDAAARQYPAADFDATLAIDLNRDLQTLEQIQALWQQVTRDPKLLDFIERLSSEPILQQSKLIVFTESKETAEYLAAELNEKLCGQVLMFSGASSEACRKRVIENFDARANQPKDDIRILVTTEVLSEGVNLHRANVVINYDIPWNPTRLMQRVGRINRVDTQFDKIYSFNFFPTEQSNEQIKLKEAAEAKIQAFITLLGTDSHLLTDGESIESHELFDRLFSKSTLTGEDQEHESELKYLKVIEGIRTENPDLFERVKSLPKKARTARKHSDAQNQLLTYFRQGKLQKFFLAGKHQPDEVDFMHAAKRLEADASVPRVKLPADFYARLEQNKRAFTETTAAATTSVKPQRVGRDDATKVLKTIKAVSDSRQYTEEQDAYLNRVIERLEAGALPKQTAKTTFKALDNALKAGMLSPLKVIALLQKHIPQEFLQSHIAENAARHLGPQEVILSEYLVGE